MLKKIFVLLLLLLICSNMYSQQTITEKYNSLYVVSGILMIDNVLSDAFIMSAGYENFLYPYLSWQVLLDVWVSPDTLIDMEIGLFLHQSISIIDLFCGATFANGIFIRNNQSVMDVPVYAGFNVMVNDFLGIKVQGKIYALSISEVMLIELNIGFAVYF